MTALDRTIVRPRPGFAGEPIGPPRQTSTIVDPPRPSFRDLLRQGRLKLRLPPYLTPRVKSSVLALDRAIRGSNREVTNDGFLRVSNNVFSRVGPSPYKGFEIPDYGQFNLDPDREYMLIRPPAELRKSLPTWAGVPLLIDHRPVSADDLPPELVIGAVIGDVRFDGDAVTGDLIVWHNAAVDAIISGQRKSLSAGYAYRPVIQPGVYRGHRYDGQMRDILVQHLALIETGSSRVNGAYVADRAHPSLQRWR